MAMISSAGSIADGIAIEGECCRLIDQHAGNRPHECRLARAVGADNGDGLAFVEAISTPKSAWKSP
jgi:hypothetical protein